jgi:hypothetical protein
MVCGFVALSTADLHLDVSLKMAMQSTQWEHRERQHFAWYQDQIFWQQPEMNEDLGGRKKRTKVDRPMIKDRSTDGL